MYPSLHFINVGIRETLSLSDCLLFVYKGDSKRSSANSRQNSKHKLDVLASSLFPFLLCFLSDRSVEQ